MDLEKCSAYGIDVVRRASGGGAVVHAGGITYSIAVPSSSLGKANLHEQRDLLYQKVTKLITSSLGSLEVRAVVRNKTDIIVKNRKISGSSSSFKLVPGTRDRVWVMHGEIFYDLDIGMLAAVYKKDEAEMSRFVTLKELVNVSLNEAYETFRAGFLGYKKSDVKDFTPAELADAAEIGKGIIEMLVEESRTYKSLGPCLTNWVDKVNNNKGNKNKSLTSASSGSQAGP